MKKRAKRFSLAALALVLISLSGILHRAWSWPQSSTPPQKTATKADAKPKVVHSVVYTPVSLATDMASITPDGVQEPKLTPGFELVNINYVLISQRPLRYKFLSIEKSTALSVTRAEKFFLQVYRVSYNTGEKRARLTAVTKQEIRNDWQYRRNLARPGEPENWGSLTDWPVKGVRVNDIAEKIKVHYKATAPDPKGSNYIFVVYDGDESAGDMLDDFFASTVVHVKQ